MFCFVVSLLLSFCIPSTLCSLLTYILFLDCPHQMLYHVHNNHYSYVCAWMYNTKPCSCLYKNIFSTLRFSVNGVCHLYICLSPWQCMRQQVLSVFVARYLAFIFTQELKTRPYSPMHLSLLYPLHSFCLFQFNVVLVWNRFPR